jgi:aspartyl-tRNA(Asn)/glutamyl-tRNA(Gln) amidotransferase subunit A
MSNDMAFRSLRALAQGLRAGEFSALELTRCFLDRIGKANPKLKAYTEVYAEQALAAADAADRVRRSGWPVGPLHGLPIAVKDLCDITGKLGTVGSKAWSARSGTTTATVVERLTAAGMIVLGKTHMVEFAFGGWGTNALCGTPWNPWDLTTHRVPSRRLQSVRTRADRYGFPRHSTASSA